MFPVMNLKETGINLRRIMDKRGISAKDIQEKEYNLSVSSYVEAKDTREKVDIDKLNKEISEIVAREDVLRKEIDKIIREI